MSPRPRSKQHLRLLRQEGVDPQGHAPGDRSADAHGSERQGSERQGSERQGSERQGSDSRRSHPDGSIALPSPSPEPPLVSPSRGEDARSAAEISALADAQLVALVRAGDRRAFEALYRRHVVFAIHLATRIEGSSRDVEDVVHDAFIKAWSRIDDLAEPAAFKSWLGSIVVFAVRSRLRRARLMNLLGLGRAHDPVDLDSLASPAASPHVRAQLAQIYALLRTRPADERIAWTLRSVEGQELETVARMTDCSLATVKRRIAKVQAFLEEHFVASEASDAQQRAPQSGAPQSGAPQSGAPQSDAPVSHRAPSSAAARARRSHVPPAVASTVADLEPSADDAASASDTTLVDSASAESVSTERPYRSGRPS